MRADSSLGANGLGPSDRPAQLEAVDAGEHDVDQHHVGRVPLERLDRVLPGGRRFDRPALVLEGELQCAADPLVVFDCQDARTHTRSVWHVIGADWREPAKAVSTFDDHRRRRLRAIAVIVVVEDRHTARPDEQADDDQHDAPQDLRPHDRHDAGDDENNCQDPQQEDHLNFTSF
jgi:hypothetical protein